MKWKLTASEKKLGGERERHGKIPYLRVKERESVCLLFECCKDAERESLCVRETQRRRERERKDRECMCV
jgi:hypothetical protein